MTRNLTIAPGELKLNKVLNLMALTLLRPVNALTLYYNKVLERQLSTRQTLHLLNAQLAFIMTVFPAQCHFVLRLLCAAWLLAAIIKCKEIMD